MNQIEKNLSIFRTISLEHLNAMTLMKRHDTKYAFHRERLSSVLEYLCRNYEILEIDEKRSFKYETVYYDSDDYHFYCLHHNKRLNRHKVRFRKYLDTGRCFFEIKFKSNKKITEKNRLPLATGDIDCGLSNELKCFARGIILKDGGDIIDRIGPKLRIRYSRITLADRLNRERLTFDMGLRYRNMNENACALNDLVIAELKQECFSWDSPFIQCFRDLRIFPTKFSKYCMGVALTERNIKTNRFKQKLLGLEKYIN